MIWVKLEMLEELKKATAADVNRVSVCPQFLA